MTSNLYMGVVENRADPLQLGRCQVRVVGLHTHDKIQLPTNDLPWSTPVQSIGSAAMNGIGYTPLGPVEGTTVVVMFMDAAQQQPIMIGTIGGIPMAPGSIEDDDSVNSILEPKLRDITVRTIPEPTTGYQLTLYDASGSIDLTSRLKPKMLVVGYGLSSTCFIESIDSGTQITISERVVGYGENILEFRDPPTNVEVLPMDAKVGDIPRTPPPKSVSNTSGASAGIDALLAAADKVGLTTKEQKCALLGIVGGECSWIPSSENYNYNPARLKQIFSFATEEDVQQYSFAVKKGMTRTEFFSWAYGPSKRGKNFLGNATDEDGGLYYGRGFIQLTGKDNYHKIQKLAEKNGLPLDIVNNPDSLITDINASALCAALYLKSRVTLKTSLHPEYFNAAKKAVGVNSPDVAARKLAYYEYFYGKDATSTIDKDTTSVVATPPADGSNPTPGPSPESIKRGTDNTGFRDPNSKYPLPSYLGEPDTNRLARGIIEGTVIELKDSNRRLAVPVALGGSSWDQPLSAYGAKYPYNKVMETESGHLQEFDDTVGQERIHTYHRAGTYTEIDPNGTQVNYIIGDNYTIMERNGFVHIGGDCNITIEGTANIYARTDANIQVEQDASIVVGNNMSIGVANDLDIAVGGSIQIKAAGDFNVESANYTQKSAGLIASQAQTMSSKAEVVSIESTGDIDVLAGGTLSADYALGTFGNGAGSSQDVEPVDLTPPPAGNPISPIVPVLVTPEREVETATVADTPEDFDTPEGRAASNTQSQTVGVVNPAITVTSESHAPAENKVKDVPVECKLIYATENFTDDYVLSKNFSLGMLIAGGIAGKHKLVDQVLKDTDSGQERVYTKQEIVCNLATLCTNVLEPALSVLPGGIGGYGKLWKISSGYRLKGVVKNESPTSDHCKGCAVDIVLLSPDAYQKSYDTIKVLEATIPYHQLILEYRYQNLVWMHASYRRTGNKKNAFTMVNDATYQQGYALLLDGAPAPRKKV